MKKIRIFMECGHVVEAVVEEFKVEFNTAGNVTAFKWNGPNDCAALHFMRLREIVAITSEPYKEGSIE